MHHEDGVQEVNYEDHCYAFASQSNPDTKLGYVQFDWETVLGYNSDNGEDKTEERERKKEKERGREGERKREREREKERKREIERERDREREIERSRVRERERDR